LLGIEHRSRTAGYDIQARNQKGALELSVQTIVIIVIAFVVLGLGLAFILKGHRIRTNNDLLYI